MVYILQLLLLEIGIQHRRCYKSEMLDLAKLGGRLKFDRKEQLVMRILSQMSTVNIPYLSNVMLRTGYC